ncbi:MAG: putative pterin-4-alpha-carbinolamine dehydratase [Frankiales bacterium]|nr:putative pterin-4-alpha-carbinolamine dehydratase [Frankiales bacterium]
MSGVLRGRDSADRVAAQTGAVRTPLTPAQLAEALDALPAWSGDTSRIRRTARLDDRLRTEVAAAADALDHHPVLEELPGGTTRLVLWTHVRDAVTELDVALAVRLDALLDRRRD